MGLIAAAIIIAIVLIGSVLESGDRIGLGYADVPAKTIVTDQYYAYGTTECSAAVKSATRG